MASDVKLISRKHADKIVDDLLNKYPKGPRNRLSKDDYRDEEKWLWNKRRYVKYTKLSVDTPEWRCPEINRASFGYGDTMLAMVSYHINEAGGMREYLRARDRDCGSRAITRRCNRLERRVGEAKKRFTDAPGRGIYRVRSSADVHLYVISNSGDTAKFLAKTMLATSGIESDNMYTTKIGVASVEILKKYNDESYKMALRRSKNLQQRIETQKAQIVSLNRLAESLSDFGNIQPDMLSE